MTVAELQHILSHLDPDAPVIISYHVDATDEGAFYEDDIVTFNAGECEHGNPVVYLLTDGFCEAASNLLQ